MDRTPTFDLDQAWSLHHQVAVRPESFGALLYHFGTRKLSFVKQPALAEVVRTLADHPSARAACVAAGVPDSRSAAFAGALATLAESQMIVPQQEISP